MITATAAEIAKAIVDDPALLRALHGFVEKVTGDADIGALLDELAVAAAQSSPFENEVALIETVRCETLQALHVLALRRMPAMGRA
jgi:hypothetical protein